MAEDKEAVARHHTNSGTHTCKGRGSLTNELTTLSRLAPSCRVCGPSCPHLLHTSPTQTHLTTPQAFWPKLTGLKWLHSSAVGLEHLLTPALVTSDVVLTNARDVYSHSLSE